MVLEGLREGLREGSRELERELENLREVICFEDEDWRSHAL